MLLNQRQKAVIKLFEYSELWSPMGYDSAEEAFEDTEDAIVVHFPCHPNHSPSDKMTKKQNVNK